jgi:hypothetical protein
MAIRVQGKALVAGTAKAKGIRRAAVPANGRDERSANPQQPGPQGSLNTHSESVGINFSFAVEASPAAPC